MTLASKLLKHKSILFIGLWLSGLSTPTILKWTWIGFKFEFQVLDPVSTVDLTQENLDGLSDQIRTQMLQVLRHFSGSWPKDIGWVWNETWLEQHITLARDVLFYTYRELLVNFWADHGLFSFIFDLVFSQLLTDSSFNLIMKKRRWCAWDSNPGPRRWRKEGTLRCVGSQWAMFLIWVSLFVYYVLKLLTC